MSTTGADHPARPLVLIQARLGSSRLPGKVLLRAGGLTLLEHLVRRARRSSYRPEIVIATTRAAHDDRLALAARDLGVDCERGSSEDVLARFAQALGHHAATTVVRLTADCPLLDPAELDRVLAEFLSRLGTSAEVAYASNQSPLERRIPRGQDVEVMTREALLTADREAKEPGEREHVTPYLYGLPDRFSTLVTHRTGPDWSRFRLTVDTERDLDLVRWVVEALGTDASLDAIGTWLDAHPEQARWNQDVAQKTVESERELRVRRVAGRTLMARADGGQRIGSGHLTRVEALLDAWTELGGRAVLLGDGVSLGQAGRLLEAGIDVSVPASGKADETLAFAQAVGAAAIVVDGYDFGAELQRELVRERPLVAMDDLASFAPVAPLVINQNPGATKASYAETSSRLMLGADYVLLRRGLRATIDQVELTSVASARIVGVAFGGADPSALSEPTARALLELLPDYDVWVVMGAGSSAAQRARLELLRQQNPRLSLLHDVAKVEDIWSRLSVLVAAAGTTAYEALALGVPCVLVPTAANQRIVADGVANAKAAVVLDQPDAKQAAERAAALAHDPRARTELAHRGRELVDGRGVWRVIDAVLDLVDRWESKT